MPRVLFIHSVKDAFSSESPVTAQTSMPFGISYISSFLKYHDYETKLLVMTQKTDFKMINRTLEQYSPILICFTSVFSEYAFIVKVAEHIKRSYPDVYLLAGGPHVSLNPEECSSGPFDAICVGEGEEAVLELAGVLEVGGKPANISNLWIKYDDKIEKNPTRPFLQDLDRLPFPDRSMWQEWIKDRQTAWPVLLGRGCPFICTYCSNHALRKLAEGKYVRNRSVNNVMEEIIDITYKHPETNKIYFEVETLGANMQWALELCRQLEELNAQRSRQLSFGVNLRIAPHMQLDELFTAMEKANFEYVNIGLESGSERVRKEILERNYSNKYLKDTVGLAKKYGLNVSLYIMVGIPDETDEDFRDTISVTREILPDYYELFIYFPYPGTELYQRAKSKGYIRDAPDGVRERSRVVLQMPAFPAKRIISNYIWFDYNVFKGRKPLIQIMATVFRSKVYTSPVLYKIADKILSNNSVFEAIKKVKNFLIRRNK